MTTFKIKATDSNLEHVRSFTPAYDGERDCFLIGTAIACVDGRWINFEVRGHTAALFASGQATKAGFLKNYGF